MSNGIVSATTVSKFTPVAVATGPTVTHDPENVVVSLLLPPLALCLGAREGVMDEIGI